MFSENEFLSYFKKRFDQPQEARLQFNMNFPHKITSDQKVKLETVVTKEEIKKGGLGLWDWINLLVQMRSRLASIDIFGKLLKNMWWRL